MSCFLGILGLEKGKVINFFEADNAKLSDTHVRRTAGGGHQ